MTLFWRRFYWKMIPVLLSPPSSPPPFPPSLPSFFPSFSRLLGNQIFLR